MRTVLRNHCRALLLPVILSCGVPAVLCHAQEAFPEQRWRVVATGPDADWFSDSDLEPMAFAGGTGIFAGFDPVNGYEVWRTDDDAPGGAVLVDNIVPYEASSFPGKFQTLGSLVTFSANDVSGDPFLWRTDGTQAGTFKLPGPAPAPDTQPVIFGGALYYATLSGEWWRMDGSVAGGAAVPGIDAIPDAYLTAAAANGIFFIAKDGAAARRLFYYDGSTAQLVKEFAEGTGAVEQMVTAGPRAVLLFRTAADKAQVWASDGTAAGTVLVHPSIQCESGWLKSGGTLVWFESLNEGGDHDLWRTDGTAAGTLLVASGAWETHLLQMREVSAASGVRLIFRVCRQPAPGGNETYETWLSGGTAATTGPVSMEPANPAALPWRMLGAENRFYIVAGGYDGTTGYSELWKLDAPALAATRILKETGLKLGEGNLAVDVSGTLRFRAPMNGEMVVGVCAGNGTTVKLTTPGSAKHRWLYPAGLTSTSRGLFFLAEAGAKGWEPWVSDGTAPGTRMVKDLATQPMYPESPVSSFPHGFTESGGSVFFFARSTANGTGAGLWSTDGTEAGTRLLNTLTTKTNGGLAARMQALNGNRLLFRHPETGRAFVSDGTPEGLTEVSPPGLQSVSMADFRSSRGWLLGSNAESGRELWITEGTAASTRLVRDFLPGPASGLAITRTMAAGNRLYLTVEDGIHGSELWVSDDTPRGTRLVADLEPGAGSSDPEGLHVMNGSLFFVTRSGLDGSDPVWRLWKLAQAGAEPLLLAEIPMSESIRRLSPAYIRAYVHVMGSASNGTRWCVFLASRFVDFGFDDTGFVPELWSSDGTPAGTRLLPQFPAGILQTTVRNPAVLDGALYFTSSLSTSTSYTAEGDWTWRTDGTPEGTRRVQRGEYESPGIEHAVVHGSRLYAGGSDLYVLNTAPAPAADNLLQAEGPGAPFRISAAMLAAAGAWSDRDGDAPGFVVSAVESGELNKNGHAAAAGRTTVSGADTLTWQPPSGARGTITAFRVTAWDGQLQAARSSAVRIAVPEFPRTYDAWAAVHGLTGDDRQPLASPGEDGVPNLIKCALGLGPLESAASRLPVLVRSPETGEWQMSVSRAPAMAPALTVILEASADLTRWTVIPLDWTAAVSAGPDLERLAISLPQEEGSAQFIRLRVH